MRHGGSHPFNEIRSDPGQLLYELWRFSVTSQASIDTLGDNDSRAASLRRQSITRDVIEGVPSRVAGEVTTWRVGHRIGQGGMSVVHEATSIEGQVGAVKLFSDHRFAEGQEAMQRLSREAQHLRAIVHPSVVRVLDLGKVEGRPALILERATESLYELLHTPDRRIGLAGALDFLVQALEGVHAMHERNLVHRDISPKNLLIFPGRRLAVADFGTVRHPDDTTITGAGMGSLLYISNEQFGDPRNATLQDDIFSLGQIGYQLLTGGVPHGNPDPIRAIRPDVPAQIVETIERMRAYRREMRPSTAAEAAKGLCVEGGLAIDVALCSAARGEIDDALIAMRRAFVGRFSDRRLLREVRSASRGSRSEAAVVNVVKKWLRRNRKKPLLRDKWDIEIERLATSKRDRSRLDRMITLGRAGAPNDVDRLMRELANGDLVTAKFVDYALDLVGTVQGRERIEYYLFQGKQQQRTYAALYFWRLGERRLLDRAVDAGAIDAARAFPEESSEVRGIRVTTPRSKP
ncbi:MAG TPA: serine/threonine-protein kinase [Solirubrobacteraceae bacterium]|nr:serine/threonine-protein kinase [Solirubrobacteraceae bacterium]